MSFEFLLHEMNWHPVILSVRVAVIATIIVTCIGVPLTRFMARNEFYGKDFIEAAITLPMVLPPSVVGYGLLLLIGKNGIIGKALADAGFTLIFTWYAAVIASTIAANSFCKRSKKVLVLTLFLFMIASLTPLSPPIKQIEQQTPLSRYYFQ